MQDRNSFPGPEGHGDGTGSINQNLVIVPVAQHTQPRVDLDGVEQENVADVLPAKKGSGRKQYKAQRTGQTTVITEVRENFFGEASIGDEEAGPIMLDSFSELKTGDIGKGLGLDLTSEFGQGPLPLLSARHKRPTLSEPLSKKQSADDTTPMRRESEMQTDVANPQRKPFLTTREKEIQTEAPLVLEKQLQDALFQVSALEGQLQSAKTALQETKLQLQQAGNQSYALKAQNSQMSIEHSARVQKDLQKLLQLQQQNTVLEEELTLVKNQNVQLQAEMESVQQTAQKRTERETGLKNFYEQQIAALQQKEMQNRNAITNKAAADKAALEQQLADLAIQNKELSQKIEFMQVELQRANSKIDVLEVSACQSIKNFRDMLKQSQEQRPATTKMSSVANSFDTMQEDTNVTSDQRYLVDPDLERKFETAQKQIKQLEQQLKKEQDLVKQLLQHRHNMENELKQHRRPATPPTLDEITQLRKKLESKISECSMLASQLQIGKHKLRESEQQFQQLQMKYKMLHGNYSELSANVQQTNHLKQQCQNFDTIVDDLQLTQAQLKESVAENKRLQGVIAQLQAKVLEKERERDRAIAASLTKQVYRQRQAEMVSRK